MTDESTAHLLKHEVVLEFVMVMGQGVVFKAREDKHSLLLPVQVAADMGEPEFITVTIVPGNHIQEEEPSTLEETSTS